RAVQGCRSRICRPLPAPARLLPLLLIPAGSGCTIIAASAALFDREPPEIKAQHGSWLYSPSVRLGTHAAFDLAGKDWPTASIPHAPVQHAATAVQSRFSQDSFVGRHRVADDGGHFDRMG